MEHIVEEDWAASSTAKEKLSISCGTLPQRQFPSPTSTAASTKHGRLHSIAKIYLHDLLGSMVPVTFHGKVYLRTLRQTVGWSTVLFPPRKNSDIHWSQWVTSLFLVLRAYWFSGPGEKKKHFCPFLFFFFSNFESVRRPLPGIPALVQFFTQAWGGC